MQTQQNQGELLEQATGLTHAQPQVQQLNTGLSLFDQGTFTQVQAIAKMMAQSSLVPESLPSAEN